jgi:HK97 family phage prohead protease
MPETMAYKANIKSEVADVDAKLGVVVSYPATFDVIDSGMERFRKGAFARTIKSWGPEGKRRIKALFDHAPYWIVGKPTSLKEDDFGLRAETQFARTTMAKDVLTLIEDEIITEQSVGYSLLDSKPAKKNEGDEGEDFPVLDLLEAKLFEYSFLAWGMNMDTPIVDIKTEMLREMGHVNRALMEGNFETDEVPEMLEKMLRKWRRQLDLLDEVAQGEKESDNNSEPRPDRKGSPSRTPSPETPVREAEASEEAKASGKSKGSDTDLVEVHPEDLKDLLERLDGKAKSGQAEKAERELLEAFAHKVGL